ncbi:hypothetical protein [Adlercreutzia sp. ZJ304]|uniref:hypothetical protein n=1 Tax=Adlercreutzia sp. ZJ304 TaxID=2709791 RepID=UPI0013ED640F|nr:hypothetical protein [Adlercreutzia sp. ZJ304]
MSVDRNDAVYEKIEPDWFKWVIHRQDSSIRKLGSDKEISKTERTIRRAVKRGSISYALLDEIAKKLDVHPDYLAGKYAWTLELEIMNNESVRDYWRGNYLDPKQFPYQLVEQERIGVNKQLMDTLLIHGISEGDFKKLSWSQRRELEQTLDRYTTQILHHWFPTIAKPVEDLEYFQTMGWQDEGDVIDAMLEYLEERDFVKVYAPEPDDNYASSFEEKYKHLPVVSLPAMTRIVIGGTSGHCSVDEVYKDCVTITPNSIRYKYEPQEYSASNLPLRWAYQSSSQDHRLLFDELVQIVADILLEQKDEASAIDVGATTFGVTYLDGSRRQREFYLSSDYFAECFALVKKMVPSEEATPKVLMTSEDY